MRRHSRWVLALAAACLVAANACETVPVTGRSQLQLVSPAQEAQMGAEALADAVGQRDPHQRDRAPVGTLARIGGGSSRPDLHGEGRL